MPRAPRTWWTTSASGASSAPSPARTERCSTTSDTTKAYKCNLCEGHPACADACPTEAITFVEGANADWIGDFAAERTTRVLARETV
jgi:Fe-S-cluster-containing hydrogenase components 2